MCTVQQLPPSYHKAQRTANATPYLNENNDTVHVERVKIRQGHEPVPVQIKDAEPVLHRRPRLRIAAGTADFRLGEHNPVPEAHLSRSASDTFSKVFVLRAALFSLEGSIQIDGEYPVDHPLGETVGVGEIFKKTVSRD